MALGRRFDGRERPTLGQKLADVNWPLVLLLCLVAGVGFAMLYSAANGSWQPWASRQLARFAVGLALMLTVALIDIRLWYRYAYALYALALVLLLLVEAVGDIGMGARRWIDLGLFQIQPSEIMKVALVLALARYFHGIAHEDMGRLPLLLAPALLAALPVALIVRQPDLGTAILISMTAVGLCFVAGLRLWKFALGLAAALAAIPVAWTYLLHDYQRDRVRIFLNPESDPLGAGYHAIQSKIALGSGGLFGKGFMQGTQSHLSFLPERHTDFIFTMLAEEFGLVGCLVLLGLYLAILIYGAAIALRARSQFARLVASGIMLTFFLYLFINVGMVTGLLPVVGVPLPLVSYGGTAMLTLLIGFGLVISAFVHRDTTMALRPEFD